MKLIQFAIATVVDANTGYGLPGGGKRIDYAQAERRGRGIRAKSVIALLTHIRQGVSSIFAGLREYRARHRDIKQLAQLDNHSLKDIGFTRGDVIALQTGQIDLRQLEARRAGNLQIKPEKLHNVKLHNEHQLNQVAVSRSASNEAIFASAKCA